MLATKSAMKGGLMNDKVEFNAFIERVRSESDIIAIISDYVTLKKKGKNYWGCCPFHSEKTPSFSVNPDKGFFYCFGCHVGGDAIKFITLIENISRWEAIKLLAIKLQIPLPERNKTEQDLKRERQFARLRDVHDLAAKFFFACLTKSQYGIAGVEYFKKRNVSTETIAMFRLGFAPNAWSKLADALLKRGWGESALVQAGLAVERSSGGIYDRFRNRVMFPICDEHGYVCGFGGRVLDNGQPKYLNSPETLIFNKRYVLFGLDLAYKAIKKQGFAIVVEGYMDVITAHSHGIANVVASLGTAFTAEQCKKIMHYANEIVFAYDSDTAGQQATIRALSIARNSGIGVRVISIPDGKDPDEFINHHGKIAFDALIDSALPLIEYQIERSFADNSYNTLEGKVKVVANLVPLLATTDNAVERSSYIKQIAQKLGIDENAIRVEINKFLSQNKKDKNVKTGQNIKISTNITSVDNAVVNAGRHMIRLLWDDNSIIPYLEAQLPMIEVRKKEHNEILQFFIDASFNKQPINPMTASANISDAANAELSHALLLEVEQEDPVRVIDDCIKTVHLEYLREMYSQHSQKADELERMGDESFLQELTESQRIKDEIDRMQD